jgi:hypothetical protein
MPWPDAPVSLAQSNASPLAQCRDEVFPMNRITEVRLNLLPDGSWAIAVTKEFAPERGGGSQIFIENGGTDLQAALRKAAVMVTLTPDQS